jgi:ABC-type glycerol-3-phosphate transport system permease component
MDFQGTKINPSKFHVSQLKFYIFLIPMGIFMFLPIVYIFSTAFKPLDELFAYPPTFFVKRPTLDNFYDISWVMSKSQIPFSRYLMNGLISSIIVVVTTMIISLSAGYVLSKKEFKFKKTLFTINTLSLMFVAAAVGIPKYLIIEKLGLIDTFAILILPQLAMPIGLFLVKQFIDQVPDALVEAAKIDGANDFIIILKIIAPIVMPALVTVAILAFQSAWNTSEASTFYVNRDSMKTLTFYMNVITSKTGNVVAGQGMAAASSLILFFPNLLIFIFMQSKVLNTMAHSGIK